MTCFVVQNPEDGRIERSKSLDGYDGWTTLAEVEDDQCGPFHRWIDGEWKEDIALAHEWALDKIERDYEAAAAGDIKALRRQVAISLAWEEVQRLKLANTVAGYLSGLTLLERQKQFPTLMALVALSGNSLTAVATAVENRLWARVRRVSLWQAKSWLAEDAVVAAGTVAGKQAAAEVSFTE